MSKIICDVCGTTYPETATQCPICGCVRSADAQSVSEGNAEGTASTYTYVKGGRFSKANVKKRNKAAAKASADNYDAPENGEEKEKGTLGLTIAVFVLLFAIIAVVVYMAMDYFGLPSLDFGGEDTKPSTSETVDQTGDATTNTTDPKTPCQSLTLDVSAITLDNEGAARMIYATAVPADTTDVITYTSDNEEVATVSQTGKVTAVGVGRANITIQCGEASVVCTVECAWEDPTAETTETTAPPVLNEEFKLNRVDITFSSKGDSWMLYSGKLGLTQITWSSDDENVATFEGGKVTAVGGGTTTVHAEFNGEKVSCVIRCAFTSVNENPGVGGSGGGITEDGGDAPEDGDTSVDTQDTTYKLKNMQGDNSSDVTLNAGTSFTLKLVDGSGNVVADAQWSVSDANCCSVADGVVTAAASGIATVSATYNGQTYSCIVRVP